ncbi:MAG: hypothetical protein QW096_10080 [Thermofilaceae archaeon]
MTIVVLIGSTGAGKTTLGKILKSLLTSRGYFTRYIEININHGFAYLLTLFLVKLLKYSYISNYYWTLRFRNTKFFCKYIQLMMLLDTLYAPIKILTSLIVFKFFRKVDSFFILDEYYFTATAEYMYHSLKLCRNSPQVLRFFYTIVFRLAITSIKNDRIIVVYLYTDLNRSIKALILRDNITIIDIPHLKYKNYYIKSIVSNLENCLKNPKIYRLQIVNFPKDVIDAIKILLIDLCII